MSNFASSKPVILKGLRAAWLDIFAPGEGMNGGAPKFKFVGLMEPISEAATLAKNAMLDAARGLWGANAENMLRSMAANSNPRRIPSKLRFGISILIVPCRTSTSLSSGAARSGLTTMDWSLTWLSAPE